jgi:T5SS/PEP-CTERM-associated repeat protein
VGSTGTVNISGSGSQWNNSTSLYLGGSNTSNGGAGTLNISSSGQVNVGNDVYTGTLGRLTISAIGSSNAGNLVIRNGSQVDNAGLSVVASSAGSRGSVLVTGSGSQWNTAGNLFIGGIDSAAGLGTVIINNQGLVTVGGDATTWAGSTVRISGGQFHSEGGWTNHGSLVFSGSGGEIRGDVQNGAAGALIVGGGSAATFHDQVVMSSGNMNIDVGAVGQAAFLGSYNGGSTGPGTVQVLGELNPGNSPGVVSFGGDLVLGTDTLTRIELGGIELGTFDQLQIAGDFQVAGLLDVSLINGFSLGFNQEFLIADVSGIRTGYFQGLNEGDLVGNFGGMDLFISYGADGGGDISLFTAVPEPSSLLLVGLVAAGCMTRRQRSSADRVRASSLQKLVRK